MQLEFYQWLVPVIALFFIYKTISNYRKRVKSIRETVLWILFWLFVGLVAAIPNSTTNTLANFFGFKSNISAVIFVSLGIIIVMIFNLYSTIDRLQQQLTELVRKLAQEEKQKEPEEE